VIVAFVVGCGGSMGSGAPVGGGQGGAAGSAQASGAGGAGGVPTGIPGFPGGPPAGGAGGAAAGGTGGTALRLDGGAAVDARPALDAATTRDLGAAADMTMRPDLAVYNECPVEPAKIMFEACIKAFQNWPKVTCGICRTTGSQPTGCWFTSSEFMYQQGLRNLCVESCANSPCR